MESLFCTERLSSRRVDCALGVPQLHSRVQVQPAVDPVLAADVRVMGNMLEDEASSMALLHDYCSSGRQTELKPHMRKIVTDWMLEVCEDQEAGPEVFLLAVHYLDTFLSTTSIRKNQFQLVAATCLLLASKFSAVVPLSAVQLVLYTDHSITVEELLHWEMEVLNSLQWQLSSPTTHSFLEQLVARLPSITSLPATHLTRLRRHANTLAALAATEYGLLLAPRSVLAGAALTAAHAGLGLHDTDLLAGDVAKVLRCPMEQVVRSTAALEAVLRPESRPAQGKECPPLPTFTSISPVGQGGTTPTNTFDVLSALAA